MKFMFFVGLFSWAGVCFAPIIAALTGATINW